MLNTPDKPSPRKPELLAPAGRMETFAAAIDAGADAVYVGAHRFNARLRAPNFSLEELSRMAAYAHGLGRKLYITVNTLIKEGELPDLAQLLDELRRIRPDALIVQDLGTYRMARALCPEIPLHASTQMTIHTPDGAAQARRMGFERVILARELTLEEIRAIRAASDIELETFVHGALCYSISGQCLFSSRVHGKSANRGRCLQPCRRLFEQAAEDPSAAYSMRDLAAAPILERLLAAGIRSFKIEGRLKPAETIAQTVRAYRLLMDAWPKITREVIEEARELLDTAVAREASTGYFLAPSPEGIVGGQDAQSGRPMGTVEAAGKDWFAITPLAMIKVGDRIRIQVEEGKPPKAFIVRDIRKDGRSIKRSAPGKRVEIPVAFAVPQGAAVVKAADTDAIRKGDTKRIEKALAAMTEPSRAAFAAKVKEAGGGMVAEVQVGTETVRVRHPFTRRDEVPPQQAVAILSEATEQGTIRLAVNPQEMPQGPLAVTAAELAAFRDTIIKRVERALDAQRDAVVAACAAPETAPARDPGQLPRRWIIAASAKQAAEMLQTARFDVGRKNLWLVPLKDIETPAFETLLKSGDAGVVVSAFHYTPEERETALRLLKRAQERGVRAVAVSNPGHFHLLRTAGMRKATVLSLPGIGCLNASCHAQIIELGADTVAASLECDAETWTALRLRIDPARLAVVAYGHAPLFQSRAPGPRTMSGDIILAEPRKNLLVVKRDGITATLESAPFMLEAHRLADTGDVDLVYDFTWSLDEDSEYLAELIAIIEQGRQLPTHTVHPLERPLE
jgi:putative protease